MDRHVETPAVILVSAHLAIIDIDLCLYFYGSLPRDLEETQRTWPRPSPVCGCLVQSGLFASDPQQET